MVGHGQRVLGTGLIDRPWAVAGFHQTQTRHARQGRAAERIRGVGAHNACGIECTTASAAVVDEQVTVESTFRPDTDPANLGRCCGRKALPDLLLFP